MENKNHLIQIKMNTWLRLNQRKAYPSQTFDTIINNLLDYEMMTIGYKKEDEKTKIK